MLDCTKLSWYQMADIVRAIMNETKRRNPIGINFYQGSLMEVIGNLEEIGDAEEFNPTCEAGPGAKMLKSKATKELKGTVYIAGAKSLLRIKKPELFLESTEFYGRREFAASVARIHNSSRTKKMPKWHPIKIKFTAEVES